MDINVSQQQPFAHSILISKTNMSSQSSQNEVTPDTIFVSSPQNMCYFNPPRPRFVQFVVFERRGRDRGWPHRNWVPNAKPSSRNWWLHSVPVTQMRWPKLMEKKIKTKVWPANMNQHLYCLIGNLFSYQQTSGFSPSTVEEDKWWYW